MYVLTALYGEARQASADFRRDLDLGLMDQSRRARRRDPRTGDQERQNPRPADEGRDRGDAICVMPKPHG